MTREEQILNGFTEMMRGFWNNQDLKVPNLETPCKQEPCDDSLPSVQSKRDEWEWIPIKSLKDIPQGKAILVCDCDGLIKIGYAATYYSKIFDKEEYDIRVSDSDGDRIKGIVAYMPLPKPYESQESENE